MDPDEFQVLVLAAFVVSVAPAIVGNLTNGNLTSSANIFLSVGGCVIALVGVSLGIYEITGRSIVSALATLGTVMALYLRIGLPGGVAKMMIALIPWLGMWEYFWAVAVGLGLSYGISYVSRRTAAAGPGLALSTAGALILPILSG
ncbi:MAG: hypothetical protein V2J51_03940 [Erythrobacter sp.]|jgi:hypothetical protein|nr:hypothetical protein [Erythrobacter sp.]